MYVSQQMFPSLPTVGNMTKHRQETMFAQQYFLVCQGLNEFFLYLESATVLELCPERKQESNNGLRGSQYHGQCLKR